MTDTGDLMAEQGVIADGFCPTCKALADEACRGLGGQARPNHKRRRPMPVEPISRPAKEGA